MNMTDHANAIHRQVNQMRTALWSLVFASIAAYLVWAFGGAPWWVYAILFSRAVAGFAQALAADAPAARPAPVQGLSELPTSRFG